MENYSPLDDNFDVEFEEENKDSKFLFTGKTFRDRILFTHLTNMLQKNSSIEEKDYADSYKNSLILNHLIQSCYEILYCSKRILRVYYSKFKKSDKFGDFSFMLNDEKYNKTIFLFNDSIPEFKTFMNYLTGKSIKRPSKGGGNASIRQEEIKNNPKVTGVVMGESEKTNLDYRKYFVDISLNYLKLLLIIGQHENLIYSGDNNGEIGVSIFSSHEDIEKIQNRVMKKLTNYKLAYNGKQIGLFCGELEQNTILKKGGFEIVNVDNFLYIYVTDGSERLINHNHIFLNHSSGIPYCNINNNNNNNDEYLGNIIEYLIYYLFQKYDVIVFHIDCYEYLPSQVYRVLLFFGMTEIKIAVYKSKYGHLGFRFTESDNFISTKDTELIYKIIIISLLSKDFKRNIKYVNLYFKENPEKKTEEIEEIIQRKGKQPFEDYINGKQEYEFLKHKVKEKSNRFLYNNFKLMYENNLLDNSELIKKGVGMQTVENPPKKNITEVIDETLKYNTITNEGNYIDEAFLYKKKHPEKDVYLLVFGDYRYPGGAIFQQSDHYFDHFEEKQKQKQKEKYPTKDLLFYKNGQTYPIAQEEQIFIRTSASKIYTGTKEFFKNNGLITKDIKKINDELLRNHVSIDTSTDYYYYWNQENIKKLINGECFIIKDVSLLQHLTDRTQDVGYYIKINLIYATAPYFRQTDKDVAEKKNYIDQYKSILDNIFSLELTKDNNNVLFFNKNFGTGVFLNNIYVRDSLYKILVNKNKNNEKLINYEEKKKIIAAYDLTFRDAVKTKNYLFEKIFY